MSAQEPSAASTSGASSKAGPHKSVAQPAIDLSELQSLSVTELVTRLTDNDLEVPAQAAHHELVLRLLEHYASDGRGVSGGGILEVLPDGFGFLRSARQNYVPGPEDIYVSPSQIRRFGLRVGHSVVGQLRPPKNNEKYFALLKVEQIDGQDASARGHTAPFESLTPINPREAFRLETGRQPVSTRIIDLLAPVGKGQRGLIVSPPKAGKTVLLQAIAHGLIENHPEIEIFILLVDERPEEVTEMRRAVAGPNCEVIASPFDETASTHTHTAEICLERARRLVEGGRDVVILLDSITRLARAYNIDIPSSGKLLSGGMDPAALQGPKRFLGSARNIDGGGSLTILGTALIDTGSRMDEVIFEEFKGTGNMEVVLDRNLADRRIFPALDVQRTGTRHEELLLDAEVLNRVWVLRRVLSGLLPQEATELMLDRLRKTETNVEFLATLKSNGG